MQVVLEYLHTNNKMQTTEANLEKTIALSPREEHEHDDLAVIGHAELVLHVHESLANRR